MKIPTPLLCLLLLATTVMGQKADRSQYPQPASPKPLKLPEVQHFKLENGLPVYLVEQHGLPLLQFVLVSNAGSIYDPSGQLGLAEMTADMMDEGAGERTALELSEEADFLGISLRTYANREELGVRLFTPTSKLEEALPLFADVLLRPRFNYRNALLWGAPLLLLVVGGVAIAIRARRPARAGAAPLDAAERQKLDDILKS